MFLSLVVFLAMLRGVYLEYCSYSDAHGRWLFTVCQNSRCTQTEQYTVNLMFPITATDENGNKGVWTMISAYGFELTIANRKWLVEFAYGKHGEAFCEYGVWSTTHDILVRQWKWFKARKLNAKTFVDEPGEIDNDVYFLGDFQAGTSKRLPRITLLQNILEYSEQRKTLPKKSSRMPNDDTYSENHRKYTPNLELIEKINAVQTSWHAAVYSELEEYTVEELKLRAGGAKFGFNGLNTTKPFRHLPTDLNSSIASLPSEFDWRHPAGGRPSPVTPVRDQKRCGSCYAFAAAAAMESRIRLVSKFKANPTISPQDIVDCNPYTYGCDGGFLYTTAGKYAEDFGMVDEKYNPYSGKAHSYCTTPGSAPTFWATNYAYIGGFYGATNEELMRLELVERGPFPVGFQVWPDFLHYKSGVYRHTSLQDRLNKFDPYEPLNHAVVVVGFGLDWETRLPYWTLKNSWGPEWGESGYFRVVRGTNECGIENLAVTFDPVL